MARLRSALAAPGSAQLIGVVVALAGIVLLVFGVVALRNGPGSSGAAPAPVTPSVSATPGPSASAAPSASTSAPPTAGSGVGSAPAPTTGPPPAPPPRTSAARAPLTVLNNSTIRGLADRAAADVQARGWQVAQVGNFAGRLALTTVYYSQGDAAQQAAARELAREFSQVAQVLPRYAGLPPTPPGLVLVVTKDW